MKKMTGISFCCSIFGLFLVVHGSYEYPVLSLADSDDYESHEHEHPSVDKPVLATRFEWENWQVAATLLKKAIKTEHGNLVFSPLSLKTSMVMVNAGAGGETAREIQTLFKFPRDSVSLIRNQTAVLNSLKTQASPQGRESGVKFVSASRIFANINKAELRQNYVRAVSSLGEVETLDFTEPTKVVAIMNEWVKTQTQGKISKIAGDKDFDKETAVVLLDTLYFKAPWKQPFDKSNTQKARFHVRENETVQVEMMYISEEFPYADLEESQTSAVFLPYKGDRFSMIIYLPWRGRKLSTLEEKLETLVPSQIRNEATTTGVSLHLPKFNISSSLDFKEILTSLGVHNMFNGSAADFSKMSASSESHVSKLVQQVLIQVNEEGAEAAAVTEAHGLSPVSAPNVLKVNRPFIFQIYDSVTGAVLLSGRVTNPNGNPTPAPVPVPTQIPVSTPKPSTDSSKSHNLPPNSNVSATSTSSPVKNITSNKNVTNSVLSSPSNKKATNKSNQKSRGNCPQNSHNFVGPLLIVCMSWLKGKFGKDSP